MDYAIAQEARGHRSLQVVEWYEELMSSTRERKSLKFLSLFDNPNSVIKAIPPFISIITFHSPIITLPHGSLF